jgi:hypothetical protein
MSEENVETSRLLWERFIAGDRGAVLTYLDADIEIHDPPDLPGATVYHCPDGWIEQIEKFREAIGEMDYEVLEQVDTGMRCSPSSRRRVSE